MATTFPGQPLTVVMTLYFGADLAGDPGDWDGTDASAYVRIEGGVRIAKGRADETGTADPSTLVCKVNNPDYRWTPKYPGSAWPLLRRGTPISFDLDYGDGPVRRYTGFLVRIKPAWDMSGLIRTAELAACGPLRRISRIKAAILSPISRAIQQARPVAYWPLTDGRDAAQLGSRVAHGAGGRPMALFDTLPLATVAGPAGDDASVPEVVSNNVYGGYAVGPVLTSDTGGWAVDAIVRARADGDEANATAWSWTTTGDFGALWLVTLVRTSGLELINITALRSTGSSVTLNEFLTIYDDRWHHVRITAHQDNSTTLTWKLFVDGVEVNSSTTSGVIGIPVDVTAGGHEGAEAAGTPQVGLGHLVVWDSATPDLAADDAYTAMGGHAGERAAVRFARVCAEDGIRATVVAGTTSVMGPQITGSTLAILRDCESADHGVISEGLDWDLVFTPRVDRYNRPVDISLSASGGQLGADPGPVLDDQDLRNRATVSRSGGASATYQDDESIAIEGLADYSAPSVNVPDNDLDRHAEWWVGTGVSDSMRYPGVAINLAASPELIADWLAAGIGSKIELDDMPAGHPPDPVEVFAEGFSEMISSFDWFIDINTSPAERFDIMTVDGDQLGRLHPSSSVLAGAVTATATALSISTPSGPLLSRISADYPVDLIIAGERVTATTCSGTTSPQTLTVTRAVNGVALAHATSTPIGIWRGGRLGL